MAVVAVTDDADKARHDFFKITPWLGNK